MVNIIKENLCFIILAIIFILYIANSQEKNNQDSEDPSLEEWLEKGDIFYDQGRYGNAIKCYNKALELDPENVDAWVGKGYALNMLGRYLEALECFNKALELDPENVDAWNNKGLVLQRMGRYEEALEYFNMALKIDPNYADAWANKGFILQKLGRYFEALECFNRSLAIVDDPQIRKIKKEIEIKLREELKKKPRLRIRPLNTHFTLNLWSKAKMEIINEGDAIAKDVVLQFSEDVSVRNLPEVEVKPRDKKVIEFYLKPNIPGEVPVEVEIRCKDHLDREHRFKEVITIEVREDVKEKTPEEGISPGEFTPKPTTPKTFPPELSDRYTEVEYIGKGGFARVFKAKRKDGKEVAVKIPMYLDESTGKAFIRELENWTKLDHKNIVKIYDYNILPIPYFEMELCDYSLADLKKPLDPERAGWLIFNIAEGLKYAHSKKIIHRDLKPQNILLKEGTPKISDWGLSKVLTESTSATTTRVFTPSYAAPEQIRGEGTDERTDIWQLGVVFYELVTGELPFKGSNLLEIGMAITTRDPVRPSEINPEAKEVEDIILKCLEKDKERRYQSVEELQKDLAKYLGIKYRESLKLSVTKKDFRRSAYYCCELLLLNMKINNILEAYKYALDLLYYSDGKVKEEVQELCNQLKMRIEYGIKDVPEELIKKAEVIAHKIKVGSLKN